MRAELETEKTPLEVRCIAVAPFANMAANNGNQKNRGGEVVADLIGVELLQKTQFGLVAREDMQATLARQNIVLQPQLEVSQAIWLGKMLGVDAVLMGSVLEYGYQRVGDVAVGAPFVSIQARLVGVESKEVFWSATVDKAATTLFAGKRDPLSRIAMEAVAELVSSMPPVASTPDAKNNTSRSCGALEVSADIDSDGILNLADRCPTRAETVNGRDDFDGCPETAGGDEGFLQYLVLNGDRIILKRPPSFVVGKTTLVPAAYADLDQLARFLADNLQIRKVMIEVFPVSGAGAATGQQQQLERISFGKAAAVKSYLVGKGIEAKRLIAVGYGELQQRQATSEIEFTIVE